MKISIIGSGTMGSGIALAALLKNNQVKILDSNTAALEKAKVSISQNLDKLIEKGKISAEQKELCLKNAHLTSALSDLSDSKLVIEAIIEDLSIKKELFQNLEKTVSKTTILASNTSSLSIASIASACEHSNRVIGIHFFNPANIMPLVEIIPAITTDEQTLASSLKIIQSWDKLTVIAKDTPGFIVNKVARPFYGEALRIYDEGIADFATIDWAMKEIGGFKMGPFELMDFIGNDINYKVTESVFQSFYSDPKYKPSLTQKRLFEAGLYGKKTGQGYYSYRVGESMPEPNKNKELGQKIFDRIIAMLINEAYDTLFWNIATQEHIDIAVKKGVNYPKGLFEWAAEIGKEKVFTHLQNLYNHYQEDRYRPCPLLK